MMYVSLERVGSLAGEEDSGDDTEPRANISRFLDDQAEVDRRRDAAIDGDNLRRDDYDPDFELADIAAAYTADNRNSMLYFYAVSCG